MKPPSGSQKTNPIKACPERSRMGQFPKCQNELKIACRKIWPHPSMVTCYSYRGISSLKLQPKFGRIFQRGSLKAHIERL